MLFEEAYAHLEQQRLGPAGARAEAYVLAHAVGGHVGAGVGGLQQADRVVLHVRRDRQDRVRPLSISHGASSEWCLKAATTGASVFEKR